MTLPLMRSFPAADEIISREEMTHGFNRLAAALQPVIDQENCLLLCVMSGGLYPLVRIAERLHGDFLIDYCRATRYAGGTSGRALEWREMPHLSLEGLTVIIVDDIYDEGLTLHAVACFCDQAGAASVMTAVMVIKDRPRATEIPLPDFSTGLTVPDRYVFGCGMDLHDRWRHLPAVYALQVNPVDGGIAVDG